jgi:hypothetical protein
MAIEVGVRSCPECGEPLDRRGQAAPAGYPAADPAGYPAGRYAGAAYEQDASSRSRLVMLLLCFFLGTFGAHRFFAGRIVTGILWLLTIGLLGLGWLYDMILIICGAFRDGDGRVIRRWVD